MPEEFNEEQKRTEIERLRVKQASVDDEDIRLALQARIDSLETTLHQKKKREEKAEPVELVPTTPEQLAQAENLIRQSKVEKMRGNGPRATVLMKEAAQVAPNSQAVLEAVGDDFAERRLFKDALMVYARAKDLQQGNVGLEQKHAVLALRVAGMGSIEDQLRSGSFDSAMMSPADQVASLRNAVILNAFFPGVGHLVVGKTVGGLFLMLAWVGALVALGIQGHVKDLNGTGPVSHIHLNAGLVIPIFVALVIYVIGLKSLGATGMAPKKPGGVDRPRPPVDLPFE